MLNPGNSATMTANEVIAAALTELGVLAAGEEPSGDDLTLGLRTLNFMLKTWTARGINLWREQTENFTVDAITGAILLPSRVQDVIDARLVNSPTYERQLQRYERSQYLMLPNKAARGVPTIFYADKQRETVTLRLWPLPGGPVTVAVDYARVPADVLESSDEIDVPRQWLEAVWVALAARLSGAYGINSLDATTVALVAQRAASLEQLLLDYDRPASVFMGPMEGSRF